MYEELERDFKGIWIPKEIWFDEELTALEKIILVEINSLDVGEKGCYASNKYLAEFCQCTEIKISNSVKKLIELGYVEVIKFDGRKRYLKTDLKKVKGRLKESLRQDKRKFKADLKKIKDINIYNNIDNNIINNNKENIKRKIFKKPTIEEINEYCIERKNSINAEAFYDFYESKDWMVGKNKMKDWKACVRTWEQRNKVTRIENKKDVPKWFYEDIQVQKYDNEEAKNIINKYK